ncbi:YCII-related domain protein [Corynebacterium atrinae]|uniref:YciI family protein n=1 Tax=Corynebacterium atrinae TaxID=1336740 RepID=UPI0025B348CA|nr:YciI family protein [Corynebacterium atrinae]WJY62245.1 YCII-related domain protein [Corynebacterium atrinae]
MTQFMLSVHHDGAPAYQSDEDMQAAFAAVSAFNADIEKAGILVYVNALQPPETALMVLGDGSRVPSSVSGRQLGGFWIVDVPSQDEAAEVAQRAAAACGQAIEVRQLEM